MQEIRFFEKTLRQKVNEHVGKPWVGRVTFTLDRRDVPSTGEAPVAMKKYLEEDPPK